MRHALVLVLLPCLLASACGPATLELPAEEQHWHARSAVDDLRRRRPDERRAAFPLPEAKRVIGYHGSHREIPPAIVVVRAPGTLHFAGTLYPLSGTPPAEREATLEAFHDDLATVLVNPEWRRPDWSSRVTMRICAEREATWEGVRDVLVACRDPLIRIDRVEWVVHRPSQRFQMLHGAWISTEEDPLRSEHVPRGDVLPVILRAGAARTLTLSVGDRTWDFGSLPDAFEDTAFLARANRIWADVESVLASRDDLPRPVRLEIQGDGESVWWAFVVKTFDLLVGAGCRWVDVPELGMGLGMVAPHNVPYDRNVDESVATPATLLGCLLAVVLAFAVTFLPRANRSRVRKPGGTKASDEGGGS